MQNHLVLNATENAQIPPKILYPVHAETRKGRLTNIRKTTHRPKILPSRRKNSPFSVARAQLDWGVSKINASSLTHGERIPAQRCRRTFRF